MSRTGSAPYAANQGIEWVALTNGNVWKVFRVIFAKPIDAEVVLDIDLLALNPKNSTHLESPHLLTRESMLKSGLHAYHDHVQATSKFYLAAVVLSEPVLETVRRELRRLSDVKLDIDELRAALKQEVIKREVIEGVKAEAARRKVSKSVGKMLRTKREKVDPQEQESPAAAAVQAACMSVQERRLKSAGSPHRGRGCDRKRMTVVCEVSGPVPVSQG